jgi:hypothetical protein
MQTPACSPVIPLSRPLHDKLFDAVGGTLQTLRTAWRLHLERRRVERELDAVADMNDLLLRDIGAPEWMISQAMVKREADRQRLIEVHVGGRFDH